MVPSARGRFTVQEDPPDALCLLQIGGELTGKYRRGVVLRFPLHKLGEFSHSSCGAAAWMPRRVFGYEH